VARIPLNPPASGWSLVIRAREWRILSEHLFGRGGKRGAVLLTEQTVGPRGPRLLVRNVIVAADGIDYIPGTTGLRALSPDFVRDCSMLAHEKKLTYIAVHNHGGWSKVAFSKVDLASHERGYPALVQITGKPVTGLVLTPAAAAGDIFLPDGTRAQIAELVVPGRNLLRLRPTPAVADPADERWDRQARVYGDLGQAVLREMRVAIIGLGGAGSIACELLARLGIGHLILIDADRVTIDNLPRLLAAEPDDIGQYKTTIAARNARRANPVVGIDELKIKVQDPKAQEALRHSDYLVLAADSYAARHFVNETVERYLIPGVQVGVKVPVSEDGAVGRIHTAVRPLVPGQGCLRCNQLINPTELALEMSLDAVREGAHWSAQRHRGTCAVHPRLPPRGHGGISQSATRHQLPQVRRRGVGLPCTTYSAASFWATRDSPEDRCLARHSLGTRLVRSLLGCPPGRRCGSIPVCSLPGAADEAWLKKGLPCS
jgi:molybdopterin/thiamine biosynthesis adenylyltransferase